MKATARFDVLQFVMDFKTTHDGNSPSIREIMAGVGLRTTSAIHFHLAKLSNDGVIRRRGSFESRNIEIIDRESALEYIEAGRRVHVPSAPKRQSKKTLVLKPNRRGRASSNEKSLQARIDTVVARANALDGVGRDVVRDDGRVAFRGVKVS